MNERKSTLFFLTVILVCVLVACQPEQATPATAPAPELANPASVYCVEQGGALEIRQDYGGGSYGVCLFVDGSACEEWAYFRGECRPASEHPSGNMNPAQAFRLDQAVHLEVLESVAGAKAVEEGEPAVAEIISRLKTDDSGTIAALAAALDGEFVFTTRMRCPAQYTLIFTLADGMVENLSYHCMGGEQALLWGDQVAWNTWAIDVPADFQTQLQSLLAGGD
jgi:putative hemolysin